MTVRTEPRGLPLVARGAHRQSELALSRRSRRGAAVVVRSCTCTCTCVWPVVCYVGMVQGARLHAGGAGSRVREVRTCLVGSLHLEHLNWGGVREIVKITVKSHMC
eukprot:212007-Prymnesium_polylepis.1